MNETKIQRRSLLKLVVGLFSSALLPWRKVSEPGRRFVEIIPTYNGKPWVPPRVFEELPIPIVHRDFEFTPKTIVPLRNLLAAYHRGEVEFKKVYDEAMIRMSRENFDDEEDT